MRAVHAELKQLAEARFYAVEGDRIVGADEPGDGDRITALMPKYLAACADRLDRRDIGSLEAIAEKMKSLKATGKLMPVVSSIQKLVNRIEADTVIIDFDGKEYPVSLRRISSLSDKLAAQERFGTRGRLELDLDPEYGESIIRYLQEEQVDFGAADPLTLYVAAHEQGLAELQAIFGKTLGAMRGEIENRNEVALVALQFNDLPLFAKMKMPEEISFKCSLSERGHLLLETADPVDDKVLAYLDAIASETPFELVIHDEELTLDRFKELLRRYPAMQGFGNRTSFLESIEDFELFLSSCSCTLVALNVVNLIGGLELECTREGRVRVISSDKDGDQDLFDRFIKAIDHHFDWEIILDTPSEFVGQNDFLEIFDSTSRLKGIGNRNLQFLDSEEAIRRYIEFFLSDKAEGLKLRVLPLKLYAGTYSEELKRDIEKLLPDLDYFSMQSEEAFSLYLPRAEKVDVDCPNLTAFSAPSARSIRLMNYPLQTLKIDHPEMLHLADAPHLTDLRLGACGSVVISNCPELESVEGAPDSIEWRGRPEDSLLYIPPTAEILIAS